MDTNKTDSDIDRLIDDCMAAIDGTGSKFPNLSYEDGIKAAIEWLQDDVDYPMGD